LKNNFAFVSGFTIIPESRSLPPETAPGMTLGAKRINACGVEEIPLTLKQEVLRL